MTEKASSHSCSIMLVSIHVLAGRTTELDVSWYMDTNDHKRSQPSQQKPASPQPNRTCWTFARTCQACAAICRHCDLLKPTTQETKKILCPPKKRAKLKNITTFRKSLFLTKYRMRYAICMPPNTKDPATNQTMVAYGNRQNAIAFARANNFDLSRPLKHLMETRLWPDRKTVVYKSDFHLTSQNHHGFLPEYK